MRVRIDSMAHLPKSGLSDADLILIKRRLIIMPKSDSYNPFPEPIRLFKENENYLSVPRSFFLDNSSQKHEIIWDVSEGFPLRKFSPVNLRPYQKDAIYDYLSKLKHQYGGGGIFNGETGFGKTVIALEASRRLGMTTIIKVHKEDLAAQWEDRIKKFFPEAKIGRIQGDVWQYEGCDFVIVLIQTLLSRYDYIMTNDNLRKYFGTEIIDECHRIASKEWSKTVDIFHTRYRIGLSATPRRKDRCENVFLWHIGQILARGAGVVMTPEIYFRETGYRPQISNFSNFSSGKQLELLSKSETRNKIIVSDIVMALASNRKVLVLSKFTEHLQKLEKLTQCLISVKGEQEKFKHLNDKKTSFYVGALYTGEKRVNNKGEKVKIKESLSKEELELARNADAIFATYKMAEDAFDQEDIDTLIMALPISDPEQAVGRIRRIMEGKRTPIVVDICDENLKFCRGLKRSRVTFYSKQKWTMKIVNK